MRPKPRRKVHLGTPTGGATCGVTLPDRPGPFQTVSRTVWPLVVRAYKCRACKRIYDDQLSTSGD